MTYPYRETLTSVTHFSLFKIPEIGIIGIFVQREMEINWKYLRSK